MPKDVQSIISRYERELLRAVIPFWEKHGIDRKDGGYFTFLDRDGSVYDTEKFMWMQWRIVYMFATLYTTGYRQDRWLDLARHGYDFLVKHGKSVTGNYYFALNKKGVPSMAPYSIYSDCFAAMGSAALYKATGEAVYKKEAHLAMRHYLERMDHPKGRWEKSLSGRPKRLTLGHYMILANLGFVMNDCLGVTAYDRDVKRSINLVLDKFWNKKYRVLFENINTDFTFDVQSGEGRHINPGHGLEAMWFILQYAEKTNDRAMITRTVRIIKALLEFGWDPHYGGIYYFMDVLGKPHVELQATMKLWWVHNEALVAVLYAYHLTRDPACWRWFKKIDAWTWRHFPDKKYGEWYAYLDRQGLPTHSLKGGKWKSFFHLPRYLLTGITLLEKINGGQS
jgi:N-acylglucosamine 2-epimerase